jgi:hypothetical protein
MTSDEERAAGAFDSAEVNAHRSETSKGPNAENWPFRKEGTAYRTTVKLNAKSNDLPLL